MLTKLLWLHRPGEEMLSSQRFLLVCLSIPLKIDPFLSPALEAYRNGLKFWINDFPSGVILGKLPPLLQL